MGTNENTTVTYNFHTVRQSPLNWQNSQIPAPMRNKKYIYTSVFSLREKSFHMCPSPRTFQMQFYITSFTSLRWQRVR